MRAIATAACLRTVILMLASMAAVGGLPEPRVLFRPSPSLSLSSAAAAAAAAAAGARRRLAPSPLLPPPPPPGLAARRFMA